MFLSNLFTENNLLIFQLFFYASFFFFNIIILFKLDFFAKRLNLYDFSKNKFHNIDTPKFGFMIFSLIYFFSLILSFQSLNLVSILLFFYLLFFLIIGYLDDVFNLNVFLRFLSSLLITICFYKINPLNFYISLSFVNFFNLFLLCFFTLGFIHLINITDGLNGLVPSLFLYSCIYYFFKGYNYFDQYTLNLILLSIISFIIFLLPNFLGKCFLGNSGSYSVAILSSFFYMKLYQKGVVEYSDILLIFLIPLLDGLRVTILRIYNKKNPFKGDYSHIHFLIKDNKIQIIFFYFLIFSPSILNFFSNDYSAVIGIMAIFLYIIFFIIIKKNINLVASGGLEPPRE